MSMSMAMSMAVMIVIVGVIMMVVAMVMVIMIVMWVVVMVRGMGFGQYRTGADALDMVMMALLPAADVAFVADGLFAIFAKLAIHGGPAGHDLAHPFGECVQHQGMIA